jgi:hypothetical protein
MHGRKNVGGALKRMRKRMKNRRQGGGGVNSASQN